MICAVTTDAKLMSMTPTRPLTVRICIWVFYNPRLAFVIIGVALRMLMA